jgi:hypothetical protein
MEPGYSVSIAPQWLAAPPVGRDTPDVSRAVILPLLAMSCAAIVQQPALGHFFRLDDFLHLYDIVEHGWLQFALTTNGGHLLITSNTAFYLCHALFGLHAEMYMVVAWLTHLLNVYLLYRVVEISTDGAELAFVAALLWGVSGLAQEAIGWFSVYGHVLVVTFVLWFLAEVAQVSRGRRALGAWTLARWILLLLLGATSFGTGIPIAMLAGPAVYLLLAGHPGRRRAALWMGSLVLLVPAVYVASIWIFYATMNVGSSGAGISSGRWLAVLGPSNWLLTLALLGMLVDYGVANLLLGPLVTSTGEAVARGPLAGASLDAVAAVSAVFSAAVLVACVFALRRASADARRQIAGYGILAVGAYGMIALARAAFYSVNNIALTWPAVQPRYHYVSQALIAIFLALAAAQLPLPRWRPSGWTRGLVAVALLLAVWLGRISSLVVNGMMDPDGRAAFDETVASVEEAIAASPPGSDVRIENHYFAGAGPLSGPYFAGTAAVFVIAFPSNVVDGRRVFFVERDSKRRFEWIERIPGTRLSELIVAPAPYERPRAAVSGARGP